MSDERIYLGKVRGVIPVSQCYNPDKDDLWILSQPIYLYKHKWDCGWYWGFGYIGNKELHCHAEVFVDKLLWADVNEVFESDNIFESNDDFWVFKDLLKQAYALRECAEVYRLGGHCTTKEGLTDVVKNPEMEAKINEDLHKVLNSLWGFLKDLKNKKVVE